MAKVELHCEKLFPRVGSIVTTLETGSRAVVRFYHKRGTAEQWIKEGMEEVKLTRLSYHRFRANEVRLWLSVTAYNLGNLWRRLGLPKRIRPGFSLLLGRDLDKPSFIQAKAFIWILPDGERSRPAQAGPGLSPTTVH